MSTPTAGIDKLSLYTSPFYLPLATLAIAHGLPEDKYVNGLGQNKMAVAAPDEDIVTLGAHAAQQALQNEDKTNIGMVLLATESGIDQSKAAAIYIHDLLDLPEDCRTLELKQACYGSTGALQLALNFVKQYPDKKALVISADIARYGLNTGGESSQGCGAVAFIVSTQPRLLVIEPEFGCHTQSTMDFWRPNYRDEALVDGRASSKLYLNVLEKTWQRYQATSARSFCDHQQFAYHTPVPKLVEKAHCHLAKLNHIEQPKEEILQEVQAGLYYNREIGNTYTAAMYIGIASLLETSSDDLSGQRIGLYAFGSGCVAEYFSAVIQPDYQKHLLKDQHQSFLSERTELSYEEYKDFYLTRLPTDGSTSETSSHTQGQYRLAGIDQHKRIYERSNDC